MLVQITKEVSERRTGYADEKFTACGFSTFTAAKSAAGGETDSSASLTVDLALFG